MKQRPKIIVVGSGIAGLTATLFLAEKDVDVVLLSNLKLKTASSITDDGGINAAINQTDDPQKHFQDTVVYSEGLANQTLIHQMCHMAPNIINIMQRIGVVFDKTKEHSLKTKAFFGGDMPRLLDSHVPLGQQVLKCLTEQVYCLSSQNNINIYEDWEFLSVVLDHQESCRGIVAQSKVSMEMVVLKADAVIFATGDMSAVFGRASTRGIANSGYSIFQLYRQGAFLAHCEFCQFYPYSIKGVDKSLAISKGFLSKESRLYIQNGGQPRYLLDDYPESLDKISYQHVVREMGRLVFDKQESDINDLNFYLEPGWQESDASVKNYLEFIKVYCSGNYSQGAFVINPAVQTTLGGLWNGTDHMTNIKGVFVAGDCGAHYHGANMLPGNGLLSLWASGAMVSEHAGQYVMGDKKTGVVLTEDIFSSAIKKEQERQSAFLDLSGPENVYNLYNELGSVMINGLGFVRVNSKIEAALTKVAELKRRFQRVSVADRSHYLNQEIMFMYHFEAMLELAMIMARCALCRNESRGFHYKPQYFERDDDNYLKTTKVKQGTHGPMITYEDIDTNLMPVYAAKVMSVKREAG